MFDGTSGLPADSYFPTGSGSYVGNPTNSPPESSELTLDDFGQQSNFSRNLGSSKGYYYPAPDALSWFWLTLKNNLDVILLMKILLKIFLAKKIAILVGIILFLLYAAPALNAIPYRFGHPGYHVRSLDVYSKNFHFKKFPLIK